jgi:hypothetical protein
MRGNLQTTKRIAHATAGLAIAAAIGLGTSQAVRAGNKACGGPCLPPNESCFVLLEYCDSCTFDDISCTWTYSNCGNTNCDCGEGGHCYWS